MLIARQSTARTVMVGPVLDASGVAVPDCVVADFEGSVNGGDPAALNGSATLTHRGVGFYSLALTATDLATVGSFEVTINDTVNACGIKEITVVEEAVYDALFAASAAGYQVPIWSSAGATVNLSATTVANVTTVNGLATDVISSASVSAAAVTKIQTSLSTLTQTQVTGGAYALNSASFAFNAALPLTTQQKSDVNAEADTAATDYGALKPTTAGRTLDVTTNGNAGIDWGNIDNQNTSQDLSATTVAAVTTVNGLAADSITATALAASASAEIADAVWDEAIAGHLGAGSTGAALNAAGSAGDPWTTALPGAYSAGSAGYIVGNNLNATVSSRSSHSAADVWAVGTRVLTAGTNIALAKGTGVTGFNDLSAADVRTAVGLASANLDTQLAALSTAIDATPTNAELNARTLLAADYATSTALAAVAGYIDTEIQTILTNLADVPTVAEFEARTLVAASYATAASIAALNDISPAEVNAEVLDVLVTDTFAEPAGPLAATASLKDRIGWVAALGRNKLDQNATEFILYADDGTTVLATGACSDDTTTTTRDKLS
jgi:hypothetical protein